MHPARQREPAGPATDSLDGNTIEYLVLPAGFIPAGISTTRAYLYAQERSVLLKRVRVSSSLGPDIQCSTITLESPVVVRHRYGVFNPLYFAPCRVPREQWGIERISSRTSSATIANFQDNRMCAGSCIR